MALIAKSWEYEGVKGVTATLNDPERCNPLDHETIKELRVELKRALDQGARAFIITGAGQSFSAGGDLRAYLGLYADPERFNAFLSDFRLLCDELETGPIVTCAMVNGACVAGGLELALSCDLVTMSTDARIGDGHLGSGQLPGAGGSQRLYRAVGHQRAKQILLTADLYPADEAVNMGLISKACSPQSLERETKDLVARCGRHSPLAFHHAKRLLRVAAENLLQDGLDVEVDIVSRYATTSFDAVEGLDSFLNRRSPEYRGE